MAKGCIDIPGNINFEIRMEIGLETITGNMQTDVAAFDAWALILRTHLGEKVSVRLALKGNKRSQDKKELRQWLEDQKHRKNGEYLTDGEIVAYHRFLYRLMKFEEFYGGKDGWFKIADDCLRAAVDQFSMELKDSNNRFENTLNRASPKSNIESKVEMAFLAADAKDKLATVTARRKAVGTINSNEISRQLPVGLTRNEKDYFSIGSSAAADLWALNVKKDSLIIYELKTHNVMVGIISELMFYCNYMRDLYICEENEENIQFQAVKDASKSTGWESKDIELYEELYKASRHGEGKTLKKVYGYMLTDGLHPLITKKVLEEMKKTGIEYHAIEYEWQAQDDELIEIEKGSIKNLF